MMIRLSSMKIALLIGTIYGRLTGEDIKEAVKKVLTPKNLEHTILNPLFGYMFRISGCLESIRFYSSELEIEYKDSGERIYNKDKGKDSLTNLLIQLFPSHTGVLNNFRGVKLDFTKNYFIENKAWYDDKKTDRKANIKMLANTFAKLAKQVGKNPQKVSRRTKHLYKLLEYYVLSPSNIPGLNDKIQKLLSIHAYAVETLDRPEELETYLQKILKDLKGRENAIVHLLLNGEQELLFEHLYANPFKFPYSKINQSVSNSSIPMYNRKEDKPVEGQNFSDCADIAILHLCNCLFYDELTGECSLDQLKLETPNRLREFYEYYHHKPFQVTQEMRNDWSRVVQGLDDNKAFNCQDSYKPYMIHYVNKTYRNEIDSGILNIMSVLASICGVNDDEYERIMTASKISEDSVADKLAELFEKICNKKVKVAIKGSDIEEIAYDNVGDFIGDFYITLDLKHSKTSVTMKLQVSQGHTSFFFKDAKSKEKEVDFSGLGNLKSDDDSLLLPSLINRYIKLLNNNDKKTENFDSPFEVFYNQGALHTNEQKRDQCVYLCEFIDKNNTFDHRITKKVIENIVKSANLSDPATSLIFRPLFIYIDGIFKQMPDYEVFETWLSLFSKYSTIQTQSIINTWNEAVKKSFMKMKSINLSNLYANSIDNDTTILPTAKDTLEDLRLVDLRLNSQKFILIMRELLLNNTALKTLAIPRNNLSGAHILYILNLLKNNNSLRMLDISYNSFTAGDAKSLACALKDITSLTTLNISGVFLGAVGIQCMVDIIKENMTLTTLDISCSNIGNTGIRMIADALKENKTLTSLRIASSNLDAKAAEYIAQILRSNNALTTLDISNNSLGPDGIKSIADALESNETLTTLNISGTISFDGDKNKFAENVAQILQSNAPLSSLNISSNNLGAEDAVCIAKALRINTKLTTLDISGNFLRDKGANHIAGIFVENEVLEESDTSSLSGPANKTLTTLNISNNNIKSEGGKYLMDAIDKRESLVCLDISENSFWDNCIDCIGNALAKNKFLKALNIQSSNISAEDSKKILEALKENKSLVELSFSYFGTQNEMAQDIADALKDNKSLKTLGILLPDDTSIEHRVLLYKAIEKSITLEKIMFKRINGGVIIVSGRVPTENNDDCNTYSKSSEFRRIEIFLCNYSRCA